ncbi:hypothetical protein BH09BAC2_BH09BAC2_15810 [soil metagenome]
MTAYNREKYITEAIESVLASTYLNWELIIVDDGSNDRTVEIANEYAAKDKRIIVYVNEKNLGDYPNRNKAAEYAQGKYIMNVDSDDKIFIDGVQKCVAVMESFPDADFGIYVKNEEQKKPYLLDSKAAFVNHFFNKPFLVVGPGGTIIKREFFKKINCYPVKYGPANDMYFNLKAAAFSSVAILPFPFLFYRIHEGQQINNKYSYLYNNYLYLRDAVKELPLSLNKKQMSWISKKNKRRFLVNLIRFFIKNFNLKKTVEAKRKAGFSFKDSIEAIFQF